MDREVLGREMVGRPPLPDNGSAPIDLADDIGITLAVRRVMPVAAALDPRRNPARHLLECAIQQMAVGQPLRIVMMREVGVFPYDLTGRRHFRESAAMPHGPGGVEVGRVRMVTVVAEITVGQQDGVATGPLGHPPAVHDGSHQIDQLDPPAVGLGRDECVTAGRSIRIARNEANAPTPQSNLIDRARHVSHPLLTSGMRRAKTF